VNEDSGGIGFEVSELVAGFCAVVDNAQSRRYPLPGPLPHHKIPWVPAGENYSDSMPPAKTAATAHCPQQAV
jgi:hypothetical protein